MANRGNQKAKLRVPPIPVQNLVALACALQKSAKHQNFKNPLRLSLDIYYVKVLTQFGVNPVIYGLKTPQKKRVNFTFS